MILKGRQIYIFYCGVLNFNKAIIICFEQKLCLYFLENNRNKFPGIIFLIVQGLWTQFQKVTIKIDGLYFTFYCYSFFCVFYCKVQHHGSPFKHGARHVRTINLHPTKFRDAATFTWTLAFQAIIFSDLIIYQNNQITNRLLVIMN